jgi:hypothetical protein
LGSILPDAFFYHPMAHVRTVSKRLHGIGDNPHEIIGAFIAAAGPQQAYPDAVFTFGYLSHLSLDSIFHPVINHYSGNYDDADAKKRSTVRYHHRLLETALDYRINDCCSMEKMIDPKLLSSLSSMRILSRRSAISETKLRYAFICQLKMNRLFTKNWAYLLTRLLEKLRKTEFSVILPLFYAHLRVDNQRFPEKIHIPYRQGHEARQRSVQDLLDESIVVAEKMIHAAYSLFKTGDYSIDGWLSEFETLLPQKF